MNIVLVGKFNPAIFNPDWFLRCGIIREEEYTTAEIEIIHPKVAIFRVGKKDVRVDENRFSVDTNEAPFVHSNDFVVRTFGEYLMHTPIWMLGINREVHFSVGSEENRNAIGQLLAPTEPWGEWGRAIAESAVPARGGMTHVTMRGVKSEEGQWRAYTQAAAQPSAHIAHQRGIYVSVNDHYELINPNSVTGADLIVRRLQERFERSIEQSELIIDQLMSLKERVSANR